jgi:outer membrane protein TolC
MIEKKTGLLQKSLLTFLLYFFANSLVAQQIKNLSLEEATQLALSHDLQAKVDTAAIAVLNAKYNQTKKAVLPEISLNGNYTRISDNITPFKVSFPTGDVTLNPQILNQSYNSLQLKQLIWSGGKANYGTAISKKEIQVAKFDAEKNTVTTIYNIAALWYNLYVVKTAKKIIEANIKTLLKSQQDVKNFVAQGIVLENEATKIDLAVTNLQSNLIDITNSIAALNFNVCILTGLPTNTVIEVPELKENLVTAEPRIDTYIKTALTNRSELKTVQTIKEIESLRLKITKSNNVPTISSIASGNYNMPEQRVFPNEDKFKPTWYIGLNVNWAISNFYRNPDKITESKQAIIKTDALYNQLQEGIMIEVNNAYSAYLQASQKIVIEKKAIEQATENFRVEQNRLNASTITATEFLDANAKLLQAKLNLSPAYANAQLALKNLDKTTGK